LLPPSQDAWAIALLVVDSIAWVGSEGLMRRSAVASANSCSTIWAFATACSNVDGLSSFT
uniref:Secreted protein n=1 Tax=Haemonchus placei TaxID=6290 RepID=A0A0N4W8K2_HAEPC